MRLTLTKFHIWLGWLAGVPLLLWTLSGLLMVIRPIEQVRGEHLRAEPPALVAGPASRVPLFDSNIRAVSKIELVQQTDGPVWIIRYSDGGGRRASAATGAWLAPRLTADEAAEIAEAAYAGPEPLGGVELFRAEDNPIDLRRERPAWRARFGGTHVYVDAETGDILAFRTPFWRAYDFMWGLHIMDLQNREDSSHPILILSAVLALLMVIFGMIVLPWRYIRRREPRG